MKKDLFYQLVREYKESPVEFQATQYWQSYENEIFRAIENLDVNLLRSGKYPIFKTFGFNEVVYPGSDFQVKTKKFAYKALTRLLGNVTPYSLSINDIRRMAYHHCELVGELSGSLPISTVETTSFGAPEDLFAINKRNYSIWFLNYYLRYCFVNQHLRLRGDEIIVELGSGSGHQIEVLKKLYPGLTILCFDLPAQIFLAETFLSHALPETDIVSVDECRSWKSLDNAKAGKVHFLGNWQFPILKNFKFDLFWNAASFGEMEPAVVKNYLSIIGNNSRSIFLTQARHGKETKGSHHVKDPITFEDYNSFLPGYKLMASQDSYLAHKKLHISGGYFDAVWQRESS